MNVPPLAAGAAAALAAGFTLRPRLRRWGATAAEQRRSLPGDGMIPDERGTTTMAITLKAPPSAVWPWLVQMGRDRAGWYSWDRLDNGGVSSARRIDPAWQTLREGDHLITMAGDASWFEVAHLEPERSLVLRATLDHRGRPIDPAAPRPRFHVDSRWEFFLEPRPDGATRLLVRSGGAGGPRPLSDLMNLIFWDPAHVIMQVRQLHGLRSRIEGEPLHAWQALLPGPD